MAETVVYLQAPVPEQADGQKGGGMHVDVSVKNISAPSSPNGEGKENKVSINRETVEDDIKKDNDTSMETSPCSSADVSLNECPNYKTPDKALSDNTVAARDSEDSKNNSKQKRRRHNKHKGGKNHRKQWKPYSKLSWEEKKRRDDKETIRALKKRDERFANGLPMAPYNTTQFLIADQDQPSPMATPAQAVLAQVVPSEGEDHNKDDASGSYESSDGEYYDSPDDEDIFMEKEFSEAYESFHVERLQQMSKEELVKEYIELEGKFEKLEKELKNMRRSSDRDQRSSVEENTKSSDKTEGEMAKLQVENAKLHRENEFLKAAAGRLSTEKNVSNNTD